jgi:hypothetical protein
MSCRKFIKKLFDRAAHPLLCAAPVINVKTSVSKTRRFSSYIKNFLFVRSRALKQNFFIFNKYALRPSQSYAQIHFSQNIDLKDRCFNAPLCSNDFILTAAASGKNRIAEIAQNKTIHRAAKQIASEAKQISASTAANCE